MKPYLKNRLIRGIAMLIQNLEEDDISILIKKNKITTSLSVYVNTSDRGKLLFKKFTADSISTLQKEAFDWLRVSLYDTYRAKKVEFNESARKIVHIEKYVLDAFDVNLNPRQ